MTDAQSAATTLESALDSTNSQSSSTGTASTTSSTSSTDSTQSTFLTDLNNLLSSCPIGRCDSLQVRRRHGDHGSHERGTGLSKPAKRYGTAPGTAMEGIRTLSHTRS